jgi:microcystin-dependent protein
MGRVLVGSIGEAGDAVGTIKKSMLTIAEFQAENGASWVLMDGADVIGSDLAVLKTGDAITPYLLPDARGQFLRGKDHGATVNPDGDTALGTVQTDEIKSHKHTAGATLSLPTGAYKYGATAQNFIPYLDVTSLYNSGAGGTSARHVNNETVGEAESRPKNITVNIFIKINN